MGIIKLKEEAKKIMYHPNITVTNGDEESKAPRAPRRKNIRKDHNYAMSHSMEHRQAIERHLASMASLTIPQSHKTENEMNRVILEHVTEIFHGQNEMSREGLREFINKSSDGEQISEDQLDKVFAELASEGNGAVHEAQII